MLKDKSMMPFSPLLMYYISQSGASLLNTLHFKQHIFCSTFAEPTSLATILLNFA